MIGFDERAFVPGIHQFDRVSVLEPASGDQGNHACGRGNVPMLGGIQNSGESDSTGGFAEDALFAGQSLLSRVDFFVANEMTGSA